MPHPNDIPTEKVDYDHPLFDKRFELTKEQFEKIKREIKEREQEENET